MRRWPCSSTAARGIPFGGRTTATGSGRALASRGFITVVADYRLYPEVKYPDFLADSAQAVRWAGDNAARFGADPGRIVLVGHI